jgi:hypothetical protein
MLFGYIICCSLFEDVIFVHWTGLMQPVQHTENGADNLYVDGGVLLNYPIECFDGEYFLNYPIECFNSTIQ